MKIGAPFGIALYVHGTFFLLLAWLVASRAAQHKSPEEIARGLVLTLAVFATVVLHELGHALMARRFGIATRSIVLLPIGGVASLERMPEKPGQELLVAIAGPAVNVVLAVIFAIAVRLTAPTAMPAPTSMETATVLQQLFLVNVSLAVFNLVPAFPMDGGRALRALLTFRLGRERATVAAARLGQTFAFLFALLGFYANPMLVLIAIFVWLGAQQEAAMVEMQSILHGLSVEVATVTDFLTVAPDEPLGVTVEHILARSQHEFPVVDGGRLVGVVTRGDVVRGLAERGPSTSVATVMRTEFRTAAPDELLEDVLPRLSGEDALMVVADGRLLGMLTSGNLTDLLVLRTAARRA